MLLFLIQQEFFFLLGVCYPDGGRAQEVVSLLSLLTLSFSQAVCPESKFGAFSVILPLLPMVANCLESLVGLICRSAFSPPQWKVSHGIGAGLGCLLPFLQR